MAITIDPINGGNILDGSEYGSPLTITGTTSDIPDGTTIRVYVINYFSFQGSVSNGTWSVTLDVQQVQQFTTGGYIVIAGIYDSLFNETSSPVMLDVQLPSIAIAPVLGDDVLNAMASNGAITVAGTATGVDGQTVTVGLNGQTYTGTVVSGAWSVTVPQADVAALMDTQTYSVTADVTDAYGNAAPEAALSVSVDTALPQLSTPISLAVAENAAATAIGIARPQDQSYTASQLNVTIDSLPTEGTVSLADGVTAVSAGDVLSVDQFAGLLFTPTAGLSNTAGQLAYTVTDPNGNAASGSATLVIGPVAAATIQSGSLLDIKTGAATSGTITFATPASGTLDIDGTTIPAATISGFVQGDTIDLTGIATSNDGTVTLLAGNTLAVTEGGVTYDLALDPSQSYASEYFHVATDSAAGTFVTADGTPCYCPGTLILTERGERPIEDLAIGDRLVTWHGAVRPIRWIGRRSYSGAFAARNPDVAPIVIKAGALADAIPKRDLMVSPLHAMWWDGTLFKARDLVNGISVVALAPPTRIDYIHLELDSHDILVAEGAPAESFIDDDSRAMFHNAPDYATRYPDATSQPPLYCAPLATGGAVLQAMCQRLAERCGLAAARPIQGHLDLVEAREARGWAQDPDAPETPVWLDVCLDDAVLLQCCANLFRGDLGCLGSGFHSFVALFPRALTSVEQAGVTVRPAAHDERLPFSRQRLAS